MGVIQIQFGGEAESKLPFQLKSWQALLRFTVLVDSSDFVVHSIFLRVTINSHVLSHANIAQVKCTKSPKIYD